ncbi:MAG TPA: hypothetical protein VGO96_01385 [Pyrinomonadaceae bacterium]|jgi:hypothetical protein|nr:hypothetical protein [Pyrinomonadaceae bacterium]
MLDKLDKKTAPTRNGQAITLVPFVRTTGMAHFSQAVAMDGIEVGIEAAAFDEAGVTFGKLDDFTQMAHPPHDKLVDFGLGMNVLLARCEVIIVVCADESEVAEARKLLDDHENTSAFVALVPLGGGRASFLEIDPRPVPKDPTSWRLCVVKSWAAKAAGAPPLPTRKRTLLGFLFPWFQSLLIGRLSETVKRRPPEAVRCQNGMGVSGDATDKLEQPDSDSLNETLNAVCPYFIRHDDLGRHYANVFRTTCFLVPLCIIISTVLAVAAAIDHERHDIWHVSEGILLLIAAALYLRAKLDKQHRKWVENRLLAEFLRLTWFNEMFHTLPQLTPPPEEPGIWVESSRAMLRRFRSLPRAAFTTPRADLLSARISAIADFVRYQSAWHTDFAAQHRTAEKRLARMSAYAFVLTLCLCVIQLIISNLRVAEGHGEALTTTAHLLMMLTLVSAGGAFVLSLLSHQLGFEAIAERSSNVAEHFESLWQAIQRSGHTADAAQVYAWAHECAAALLAEQHSWYRHIPLIRMHL